MRKLLIAAALGVVALASPAFAADISQIGCVRQELPPAVAKDIVDSAHRAILGEEGASVPAEGRSELEAASKRCQKRFGWSDTATVAARQYALAGLGLEGVGEVAEDKGVKVADVRAALEGMTPAERESMLKIERDGIIAFMRELNKLNVEIGENGSLYGGLGAAMLMEMKHRDTFVAS